jgi:uncharacterized membrane protein
MRAADSVTTGWEAIRMNEPRNPYAPPSTPVEVNQEREGSDDPGRFIPYGRSVSAGRGAAWIGNAWRLLKAQPGMWAAALILMFAAYMFAALIPVVSFFAQLLVPFVYAAIALAADEQRRTGSFELKVLWSSFEKHTVPLLVVGGVSFLASVVFLIVLAGFVGSEVIGAMMGTSEPDPSTFLNTKFWLAFLIGLALALPIGFATYLAPQLIVLHDQPPIEAMKMSLVGSIKNILPGIVFGLLAMVMLLLSMITLLLGLLITMPILAITNYTVYRDIFVEDE